MDAMVAQPTTGFDRRAFDAAYDKLILGRRYVEFEDYYRRSRGRYRVTMQKISGLGLPPGSTHLDIGGGQFAVLSRQLLGFKGYSGDVVDTAREDLAAEGVGLMQIDLFRGEWEAAGPFDLITLCEVIEHIPKPPYLVLRDLKTLLKPGGILLMTTPNGYRIRNLLYMIANRQVLGVYRYPERAEGLGHQHEYTLWQMDWQVREAGLEPLFVEYYQPGFGGFSLKASIAHALTAPFALVPHFRSGLVMAARA